MSRVVLVAINGDDVGVAVLGNAREGLRLVVETCSTSITELPAQLAQLADLYGTREPGRWACASAEEAGQVATLAHATPERAIVGRSGLLEHVGRPIKMAALSELEAHSLAYRRVLALARSFKLRTFERWEAA